MPLKRTPLVAYRSSVVTPDVAEALRLLEEGAAKQGGVRVSYGGVSHLATAWDAPPGPTGYAPHLSMRPTGREVYVRIHLTGYNGPKELRAEVELATLWGLALPLGFTPWTRHCVPGAGDEVLHFFGPWQCLYDHLCSEGRGELAWSSVCCAAQVDVGTWYGTKKTERFVQAQLHRLGLHCGPVDGDIGPRTLGALRALGIQGTTMEETANVLSRMKEPQRDPAKRRLGQILLPGDDVSVVSYGRVATAKTKQGVALTVDGPGRVILDVGREV